MHTKSRNIGGAGNENRRYNMEYILPAPEAAGEVFADRIENGFDMQY